MKRLFKTLLVTGLFITLSLISFSQNPPHPNGGNGPTGANTPVGGGAPIDGGLSMMLILGAAYGSKKIYKSFKKD